MIDAEASPVNWSPHTWAAEVADDCGVGPHPRAADRLAAGLAVLHTPGEFFTNAHGFSAIVEGLAADWFDPAVAHPPAVAEMARAVVEAHLIRPPGDHLTFGPAVVRYVQLACKHEGYARLPEIFRTFGMVPDPAVAAGADLAGDPDLAAAVAEASADLEAELDAHVRDWIRDTARRLAELPMKHSDPRPLAAELAAQAD